MTKTTITTNAYYSSHLRQPRGRGAWAFCPEANWNKPDYLDHVVWIRGFKTFAEAKKEAIAILSAKGIRHAIACP
jgi:hypothetical protein